MRPQPADPIDLALGARIIVRRRQLGVSQKALADHLGVSFQQVQKYERAANRVSASMLVRVADKLETTVAELVSEITDSAPDLEMYQMLAIPGALDLINNYAKLPTDALRNTVLRLARSMAEPNAAPSA